MIKIKYILGQKFSLKFNLIKLNDKIRIKYK